MSASSAPLLTRLGARVRWWRVATELLRWLPWVALAWYAAFRAGGAMPGVLALVVALVLLAATLVRRWRGIDRPWLIRALDRNDAGLQDSGDLLFADAAGLNPLETLQQERVCQRLQQSQPDLREPLPWSRLRLGALAALACAAALWFWPSTPVRVESSADTAPPETAQTVQIQSLQAHVDIVPPQYTGLPSRRLDVLEGEVAQGSELVWDLRFGIVPSAAQLRFVDGDTLELVSDGERWRAGRQIEASTLYRIELDGAPALPERPPYRIDAIPDRAPKIIVLEPERTLTVLDAATPRWALLFEASDDYALGPAQLELTLAQGSGEQVTVSERRVALRGQGDARTQRFEHRIDLAALGFAQGDDLIARLDVRDQRQPAPNVTRSASFILRWPPPQGAEGSGVEGLVQQAMPAYFRSQRQIIIDTEALIAEWPTLDADTAMSRSDAIGVDQRILRLRYGQFLGEESETESEESPAGEHGDEHADAGPARFGDAGDLMAAAGHLHDLPEAATLLDPDTKKLLRAALDEMWQAERELRSGTPVAALPYEKRALDFIKRVQQADRIYLARVGLELPQLDASRRLTGERPRSGSRTDPLIERIVSDVPAQAWNALRSRDSGLGVGDASADAAHPLDVALLDTMTAWLRDAPDGIDDPLALLAEIDGLRRDADCSACRERLARQIWPALSPPAAAPLLRPRPDTVGAAYLDALSPTQVVP